MRTLTSLALDRSRLPVATCPGCGRRGLAYLDISDDGTDSWCCLGCGGPIAEAGIHATGERQVEALGYVFLDHSRKSAKLQKLSGCGAAGVKSCGTGGCSSGSCSGGGCSGGSCGG